MKMTDSSPKSKKYPYKMPDGFYLTHFHFPMSGE